MQLIEFIVDIPVANNCEIHMVPFNAICFDAMEMEDGNVQVSYFKPEAGDYSREVGYA